MFCKKCGRPVEGEQTLCAECAATQATTFSENDPVKEPSAFKMPDADTFTPNIPAEEIIILSDTTTMSAPKAPKKKKGGLIALIAALVVVAAVAVGFFLFKDSVGNLIDRTLQSPEEYLQTVESNAIAEFSADLTAGYGKALDAYAPGKTAAAMDIRLKLGNELLSMAESALQQQGMSMDLDWLSDIKLSASTNMQGDAMQMVLGLGLGNTDLLSLDLILDAASGMFYMAIPEVSQEYLGLNMYMLDTDFSSGNFSGILNASTEAMNNFMNSLPSEKELNKLLNNYVGIILSCIDDVEKENDTLSVGGVSQKVVVLTAKIKEKDMINIAEKLLKEAQKDKTLEKLLDACSEYANAVSSLNSYYYEPVDLYEEFTASVPSLLASLEQAKAFADSSNYMKLCVYVDTQGKVRGHELAIFTDGQKMGETISWLTAMKGDTTYIEATLGTVEITGEMTESKDTSEGEIDLKVSGRKLCTLEFENLTENSCTLRFVPSEDLMEQMLSGSSLPASLLSGNVALELVYDAKGSKVSYEFNFLVGGKTYIGLDLATEASSGGKITMPSSWTDPSNQEAVMQWLQNADLNAIVTALEQTAIPQELVNTVKSYIEMLRYYLG